jgi:hypothetical protein
MKSIFVQIASYHDYELSKTIYDALEKASGQTHINFGVHSSYFNENDIYIPDLPNVKKYISKAPDNIGMGMGRFIAHSFYNGEDYYLQIDAHMRFDYNWDIDMIRDVENYRCLGFEKPLITDYPKPYWYEDDKEVTRDFYEPVQKRKFQSSSHFSDINFPMQTSEINEEGNVFTKSLSGGSVFTIGDFITPNTRIYDSGEELFLSLRAYTNGFDLLLPKELYLYHLYYLDNGNPKNARRRVWSDFPDLSSVRNEISHQEIVNTIKDNALSKYHLGSDRTLSQFEDFAGIKFLDGINNMPVCNI